MPKIKNFKPRIYQETILESAIKSNTLIVLPTGLGKTKTAILTSINRLNNYPKSKVLFLTPTKPLASQIAKEIKESTDIENVSLFTGTVQPQIREELFKDSKIIVSTPQCIENDIINQRLNLKGISLIVFDEAHRAVKDYSYTWIAKQYNKKADYPRIIGLTASPGSELDKITETCKNLYIENIEARTEEDPDVKPYIQETEIETIIVELPKEFKETKKYLEDCFKSKLIRLKELGIINSTQEYSRKKQLLSLQGSLQGRIAQGEKTIRIWQGISTIAEAIKTQHALEMLETQGTMSLYNYMKNLFKIADKTKVKAVKNLTKDPNFKSAWFLTQKLIDNKIEHPKLTKLKEILKKEFKKNSKIKVIVFNQFRDSAKQIEKELNELPNAKAKLFVGQAKKSGTGLSQKEQIAILKDFGEQKYNCIISTSIGEEGLDIPKVDLVIFYEPVPSAIRKIQRKGRTARQEKGRLIMLVTKNTRDEAYHWAAFHKEKRMYKILKNLKEKLKLKASQPTLSKYIEDSQLKIIADAREKGSGIVKKLVDENINVNLKNIDVADYIISDRIGIERKTKEDFVNSIINKRLLHQIKDLKENFERPLIILEGSEDIFSIRNIHPNAIRGMLATIAISYGIPIISTNNNKETAELIRIIAQREQKAKGKEISIRVDRKPLTTKEQQEFIIESLPGVGPTLAKSLLTKFKTVKKIINAKDTKLQKIEQLGPKKAKEIKRILEENYSE